MDSKPTPNNTPERAAFKISFGTMPENIHEIDAELLGENLNDLSKLIKNTVKTLKGESAEASLKVAAHKQGSFEVEVVAYLMDGGIETLRALGILSSASALTGGSLLGLLKHLRNRNIVNYIEKEDGNVIGVLEDDEEIEMTEEVHELLNNYPVRKSLEDTITKPMKYGTIGSVKIGGNEDNDNEVVDTEFTSDNRKLYIAPPKKDLTVTKESIDKVKGFFTVISFEKPTGWKFRIGEDAPITIKISDNNFWGRVSGSKRNFTKGQEFEVDLKTLTKNTNGNITTTYTIEKVW